ncbi:hypothetical protein N9C10_03035 [Flavobacteriaceae bacterium]|nr:hypothetical protein [Flavobacteriaceae bacterium]
MTLFYWWSIFINFFKPKNNKIVSASLEYTLSDHDATKNKNKFWQKEMRYWSKHSNEYLTDITCYYTPQLFKSLVEKRPKNIENYIVRIKYYFNDKLYKFITRNPVDYDWPPSSSGMKFVMPISKAYILDTLGNQLKVVTDKVKKCAGPKFNFHNQKIKVSDIFDYEHAFCQIEYIDGTSKIYKFDDYLN